MPAITVEDNLVLPRIPRPDPTTSRARPVGKLVGAHHATEGAGVPIRRPFPGASRWPRPTRSCCWTTPGPP
jgi:hypothetical protein